MRGYYVVTQKIKDTLEQDPNVNTVNTGIIQDVLLRKANMYPYSHLIVNNSTYNGSTWSFNLSVICMDIVDLSKDETQEIFLGNDNQQDVLNTQLAVINRMLEVLRRGEQTNLYEFEGQPNCEPFIDRFEHGVAGWTVTFDLLIPNDMTVCDEVLPLSPVCDPVTYTISDSLANVLYSGSVVSGGTLAQVISNATVTNSLGSTLASIEAQGTVELADVNNIDSDGSTVPTPAGVAFTCTPAEDVTFTLNTNQASLNVPSGETINVNLKDQNGNIITPSGFTGAPYDYDVEINIPTTPIGAKLIKTGQTTSYRTGDDGDIEAGRATDFNTLSANNPFSNTNRFTDELGGQTYTNNIVIDWTTYDSDGTVLGYYRNTLAGADWSTQIDSCLALSIGTYTTGWRLLNIKELENILNRGYVGVAFEYSPLNINIGGNYWTSTSNPNGTTTAFYFNTGGSINSIDKSFSMRAIPVRTFTVTGTTLT